MLFLLLSMKTVQAFYKPAKSTDNKLREKREDEEEEGNLKI